MKVLWFGTAAAAAVLILFVSFRKFGRYVYLTMKIPGPSLWEYATVHLKKLIYPETMAEAFISLAELSNYKPYGIWLKGGNFAVVVNDCDSVSEVLKNRNMLNKPGCIYDVVSIYAGRGLVSLTGPQYKHHRKLVSPALRKAALEPHLPRMNEEMSKMVAKKRPQSAGSEDIDIEPLVEEKATSTALSVFASGELNSSKLKAVFKLPKITMELITLQAMNPFWILLKFDKSVRKKLSNYYYYLRLFKRIMHDERVLAAKRLEKDARKPCNVLECLAQTSGGVCLSEDEYFAEACHLITASLETTEFSELVCYYLLALHPEIQERVADELESIFGSTDRPVEPADLTKMDYLELVLKETMRLFPPVPLFVREVEEETNLNGMILPKKSTVFVDLLSLHRNPSSFKDPLKFDPERFSPEGCTGRHPFAYVPFSFGLRNCPGQLYGMIGLKTSISHTVRNFKILPGKELQGIDNIKCKLYLTFAVSGVPLRFISRRSK